MRLKESVKINLIKYAKKYFGEDIKIYLFGSRVVDNKKGGDIDIFVESKNETSMQVELYFLRDIYKFVTERKIDLLIKTPSKKDKSIFTTAIEEGIELC